MVDYGNDPVVHIFGDSEAATARMRRTAEAVGCRVGTAASLGGDTETAAAALPGGAILIELRSEMATESAIPLLDWLQREAEAGTRRGVVSAPVGLIDLVAASACHAGIEHLCEADETERVAAVGRAIAPVASRVRDDGGVGAARLLQPSADYAPDSVGPGDLPFIRAVLRARRLRDEHFPAGLFADPAWDILLDLLAARLEHKRVIVSSLCVAAAVPPTTALRWIAELTARGLLLRTADVADRRRIYVELSDATARALGGWLRRTRQLAAETL